MVQYSRYWDDRGFTEYLFERALGPDEIVEMDVLFEGLGRLDWRDTQTLRVWEFADWELNQHGYTTGSKGQIILVLWMMALGALIGWYIT